MNLKPLEAGKWLKVQALIDSEEMQNLFEELGDFFIFNVSAICKKGEEHISKETFLSLYHLYIEELKNGKEPQQDLYHSCFSSIFTAAKDHIYTLPIQENRLLVQILKPVIQLQSHSLDYSPIDGKFRSMVFGKTISWGIQFSYPQIFENPETKQVEQVKENSSFPNTALFHRLQRWVRYHTIPTPFVIKGKRTNVPIRLGKNCLSWINLHPQLIAKGLRVEKK